MNNTQTKRPEIQTDTRVIFGIILLGVLMYSLTLRGNLGNPTLEAIGSATSTSPFESSHEKGPYGHVVSLVEHGTYALTRDWAETASPDVGVAPDGRFASLFAPGIVYMATPLYFIGRHLQLGQIFVYAVEPIVSIVTLIFIFLISTRVFRLPEWVALFSVLVYGFASTSWSYAITFYQNAFSACFIVTGFYAVWKFSQGKSRWDFLYAGYAWLAYALAFSVDYPNALLMLPIMIYLAYTTFSFQRDASGYQLSVRYVSIVMFIVFVLVTGLHMQHNATYYGGPQKLAGGLKSFSPMTEQVASMSPGANIETVVPFENSPATTPASSVIEIPEKNYGKFFSEYKIPYGLYILLVSDERGLFFFTPIFLASFLGIGYVIRQRNEFHVPYIVITSLIVVNILLYSSWGDPWGGWAFGPRYLIPSFPWWALLAGTALLWATSFWKKLIIYVLFLYSSAVALLGALTSNAIPTKGEVLRLPEKGYNYFFDLRHLYENESGSFVYKTFFVGHISLIHYFFTLYVFIALLTALTIFYASKLQYD